jgi:hypothetical protein
VYGSRRKTTIHALVRAANHSDTTDKRSPRPAQRAPHLNPAVAEVIQAAALANGVDRLVL